MKYIYKGEEYFVRILDFLPKSEMELHSAEKCVVYPFEFSLNIEYTLNGRKLSVKYSVLNRSGELMYFSFGEHSGFNPERHGQRFREQIR